MTNIGQFGVVRTKGFYGEVIRLGTRSQVNHAFIVVNDHGGIVEAEGGGVHTSHMLKYPDAVYSRFPFTQAKGQEIADRAMSFVGTPYNWIDIGVLALMSFGFRQQWMLDRAKRTDQLFCSQLVDLAYRQAGIQLFSDRPTGLVVPGDLLYEIIAKHSACTALEWAEQS